MEVGEESREGLEGWLVGGFWVVGWVPVVRCWRAWDFRKYLTWFVRYFRYREVCLWVGVREKSRRRGEGAKGSGYRS